MINLRTNAAKKREAAKQVRLSLTLEQPFADALRGEFKRVMTAAAAHIRRNHDVGQVIAPHKERLRAIFNRHYRAISKAFFTRAIDAMGKASLPALSAKDVTGSLVVADAVTPAAAYDDLWSSLQDTVGLKIGQISDTTREQIQSEITDGVRDGVGWDDIASNIEDMGVDSYRADVIARTEAHAVSQESNLSAADSLGLALSKQWVAVEDHRTRPDHAEADGQDIAMDDLFLVGGFPMKFPGDPSAPADQVVNCRCATVFNLQE